MTALELERVRPLLEAEVQRLIDLLDQIDEDPDFEEGADLEADMADEEPWLGAPDGVHRTNWSGLDCQGNDDREEDTADGEPWLGASEPVYNGSYSRNSIKDMIHRNMRPDLYAGIPSVTTGETSQLGWSSHEVSDDRELVDEREPFGEGSSCYAGPCSDLSTMLTQPASDAATQPGL